MKIISTLVFLALTSCSRGDTDLSLIVEDVIKHKQGVSIDVEPLPENKGKK